MGSNPTLSARARSKRNPYCLRKGIKRTIKTFPIPLKKILSVNEFIYAVIKIEKNKEINKNRIILLYLKKYFPHMFFLMSLGSFREIYRKQKNYD